MPKPDLSASSPRLYLRPLTAEDLPLTMAWRNASRHWFLDSSEITEAGHRAWFESYLKRDNDVTLIVAETAMRQPVGQVAIYEISADPTTGMFAAEFGRCLVAPGLRRIGIGTEAVALAVSACTTAGIRVLSLEVKADNTPAIRAYARNGFTRVGADEWGVNRMRRRDCGL